jgi:LacI family transcriptional regulator
MCYHPGVPRPLHIGLVFDTSLGKQRSVLRGIMHYAQTRPRWTFVLDDAAGLTRHTLDAMHLEGLIAYVGTQKLADELLRRRRPVVNVSSLLPGAPFPRVMADHRRIGRMAFDHLRGCGLAHFGFLGHAGHLYSTEREAGFRDGLDQHAARSGPVDEPSHASLKSQRGNGKEPPGARMTYHRHLIPSSTSFLRQARRLAVNSGLIDWLQSLPKPVGVFASHDIWGVPIVEACRRGGLRVPDEVAVIGVDNDDLLCLLSRPSLSSVVVADERIGYEAAALLDRLLRGEKQPTRATLVAPTGVVTRQSSDMLAGGDPDLTAAVRFIRDHAHQPLHVEDVLRQVRVSRRSLELKFRTVLRRGIAEELRRVHLERARQLLASTSLPVGEVAERAGFASVYYMSRIFRTQLNQTPTAYRRQFHS